MKFRDYEDPFNFGMWFICMFYVGALLLLAAVVTGIFIHLGCMAIGPSCIEYLDTLHIAPKTIDLWTARLVALYVFGGITLNLILRVRQRVQAAKRLQELARAKAEKDLDQFIDKLRSIE